MKIRLILAILLAGMTLCVSARKKEDRSVVRLETTKGVIRVALHDDTPLHRDNFIKLVRSGYYDGTLFHRVIQDFIVQGGDPESKEAPAGKVLGTGGPGYTLPAEIDWPYQYHLRGMVAMARKPDNVNPQRRSSGSQFFIVWGTSQNQRKLQQAQAELDELTDGSVKINYDQASHYEQYGGLPQLDGQYTIFGEVIEGLPVVKSIQKVDTDAHDRPLEDVVVIHAVVEQMSEKAAASMKDATI